MDGGGYVALPHGLDVVAAVFGVDVDGLDLVGELHGEAQTFLGDAGPAVHGDDDERVHEVVDVHGAVDGDFGGDAEVVALDGGHEKDQTGDEDGGDPCAFGELGDEDDDEGDAGGDGSDAVDDHAMAGVGRALFAEAVPVDDHAGLREGEGEEGADGEERDELVGDAAKEDEEDGGEADEGVDAVGVEEAAATNFEDVREGSRGGRWRG